MIKGEMIQLYMKLKKSIKIKNEKSLNTTFLKSIYYFRNLGVMVEYDCSNHKLSERYNKMFTRILKVSLLLWF